MPRDHSSVSSEKIDEHFLRAWPLPMPGPDADKEKRGRVLVIGGSREIPGAVLLAANAALHAGAGKVTLAVSESIAPQLALAVPEARVIALNETAAGCIAPDSAHLLKDVLPRADSILIGPGMQDENACCAFVEQALPMAGESKIILDASAMSLACSLEHDAPVDPVSSTQPEEGRKSEIPAQGFLRRYAAQVLLTPHAGEMARLTGLAKEEVAADPATIASAAARQWNAAVALKGGRTFIAAPDGRQWEHVGGNIGLAVSGSGDTLAGIIAGLAARGATLEQACVWGVALHARAGEYLAEHSGPLGYLVRDLSAVVPMLMHRLSPE